MSILSDTDLKRLLDEGELIISPFNEARLTPIGYNLSVGEFYVSKSDLRRIDLQPLEQFKVRSGGIVAIRTLENLQLPKSQTVSALVQSKVKMINAGFAHLSSTIDSDHSGHLLISVQNLSGGEAELVQGQPFCTIVFFAHSSPSTRRSNNTYDEHEIVENLLATWSRHRGKRVAKLWQAARPLVPILFVAIAAPTAFIYFGSSAAFGGVMGAIAAIAVLMEKFLNR